MSAEGMFQREVSSPLTKEQEKARLSIPLEKAIFATT
jgi:hypothetical protein